LTIRHYFPPARLNLGDLGYDANQLTSGPARSHRVE
jgi:hypothetical protein